MINKISTIPHVSSSPKKKRKGTKQIEIKKNDVNQTSKATLTHSIISAMGKENISTEAELRKKLILETLTQALGKKASNEMLFKQLANKIDTALGQSTISQAQLLVLLEKINK